MYSFILGFLLRQSLYLIWVLIYVCCNLYLKIKQNQSVITVTVLFSYRWDFTYIDIASQILLIPPIISQNVFLSSSIKPPSGLFEDKLKQKSQGSCNIDWSTYSYSYKANNWYRFD